MKLCKSKGQQQHFKRRSRRDAHEVDISPDNNYSEYDYSEFSAVRVVRRVVKVGRSALMADSAAKRNIMFDEIEDNMALADLHLENNASFVADI